MTGSAGWGIELGADADSSPNLNAGKIAQKPGIAEVMQKLLSCITEIRQHLTEGCIRLIIGRRTSSFERHILRAR
jgi:hypothetical protein